MERVPKEGQKEMNQLKSQISDLIETTASEITVLVEAQVRERAMGAFTAAFGESNGHAPRRSNGRAGARRKAVARRGAGRSKKRGRGRATSDDTKGAADNILSFVREHPESGSSVIRTELGIDRGMFTNAIKALGSKLRKKGEKRGTVYVAR